MPGTGLTVGGRAAYEANAIPGSLSLQHSKELSNTLDQKYSVSYTVGGKEQKLYYVHYF